MADFVAETMAINNLNLAPARIAPRKTDRIALEKLAFSLVYDADCLTRYIEYAFGTEAPARLADAGISQYRNSARALVWNDVTRLAILMETFIASNSDELQGKGGI